MRSIRSLSTFLLALLLASGTQCARADSVIDAQAAIMNGEYTRAVDLLHPEAARGNAIAQYVLGNMYRDGWGVPKDDRTAALWYQSASNQGNVDAQYMLGLSYQKGLGVPKDLEKAAQWIRRAAVGGKSSSPAPQYLLGMMYWNGEGVQRDPVAASMWLDIASINALAKESQDEYAKAKRLVEQSMTSTQINVARDRMKTCLASKYTQC